MKGTLDILSRSETFVNGGTGGSYTIDLSLGTVFQRILNADCTFTFSNPPTSGKMGSFILILQQSVAVNQVYWPTSVMFEGGVAPDISTASLFYVFKFFTVDAGTTWFCFFLGNSM